MEKGVAQSLFADLKDGLLTIQINRRDAVILEPAAVVNRHITDDLDFGIELSEIGGRSFVVWNADVFEAARTEGYQMGSVKLSPRILLYLIHQVIMILLFPEGSIILIAVLAGIVLLPLFGGVVFPLLIYPQEWWPKLALAMYAMALIFLVGIGWRSWRARRLVWRPTKNGSIQSTALQGWASAESGDDDRA